MPKGQLISKTIYSVLDSPKKTNENHLTLYIIVKWLEVRKTKIAFEII